MTTGRNKKHKHSNGHNSIQSIHDNRHKKHKHKMVTVTVITVYNQYMTTGTRNTNTVNGHNSIQSIHDNRHKNTTTVTVIYNQYKQHSNGHNSIQSHEHKQQAQ